MCKEKSLEELRKRIKITRENMSFDTRQALCDDYEFNIHLKDLGYFELKRKLNINRLEVSTLRNIETKNKKKIDLNIIILALCKRFNLSVKLFKEGKSQNFLNHLLEMKNLNNKIETIGDVEYILRQNYLNEINRLNDHYKNKGKDISEERINSFLDEIINLSQYYNSPECLEISYQCFEHLFEYNLFPHLVFNKILISLRIVSNKCYLNIPFCQDKMKLRTEDSEEIAANRNYCESLIRLISGYNEEYNFKEIDFSGLDLRRLYLFNDGGHEINNLQRASFKNSNIAYALLSGIDLTNASFEGIICAKNAWFVGSDTILNNVDFTDANLEGVNIDCYHNPQMEQFVGIKEYSEEAHKMPFLSAKSFKNTKMDDWLKSYLKIKQPKNFI